MANSARNQPGKNTNAELEFNPLDKVTITYEKNKKRINTIATVIIVAVVGFFAYLKLYKEPQENKAFNALSYPQAYFMQDSLNTALNGDGQHIGFAKIAKKYSGTKAANLSNYYAGVCYLRMNDAKNAIKFLKEFDGNGTSVEYMAYGVLGDAYMNDGNLKEGINYYNKAAEDKENIVVTPMYLYRAGVAYEMNNQLDKAKENFKLIRDKYPTSVQARDIDKALARLGVLD